jgi:hypothetical protein
MGCIIYDVLGSHVTPREGGKVTGFLPYGRLASEGAIVPSTLHSLMGM